VSGYPALLILDGQPCVVVGGGVIAARKVEALESAGARVRVIAPELTPELEALAERDRIDPVRRAYQPGDLEEAFLVIAATDDPQVNTRVWEEARERGQLINSVDDVPHCNFFVPAVVRRGDLTLAVSTNGKSPAMAGRIRRELEERYGEPYAPLLTLLGEMRALIADRIPDFQRRKDVWYRLVDADLLERMAQAGPSAARERALELIEAFMPED
jgi:precorrin-2 dehydrogenase